MTSFKLVAHGDRRRRVLQIAAALPAQQIPTGRIVGRVIDAATGQGIPDAGVQVVGTTKGVQSGVDGRFTLSNVDAGTITIQVRRVGYSPKTVTGLLLNGGQTLEQNVTLAVAVARVEAQIVTASAERGTVNDALDQQRPRRCRQCDDRRTDQSKSRRGCGAGSAASVASLSRTTSIAVRGLGERYTTASLNGARVPAPSPKARRAARHVSVGTLQSVTTLKTFTPDQQGDFAGALVDIRTKEFPAQRSVTLQMSGGYAPGTSGRACCGARRGRRDVCHGEREGPPGARALGRKFSGHQSNHADQNLLISQFRNAWTPDRSVARPNSSAALSVGGMTPSGSLDRIFVLGLVFARDRVSGRPVRALADRGNTPGTTKPIDVFTGQTTSQSVLWGA
jgi:hypothetical protein